MVTKPKSLMILLIICTNISLFGQVAEFFGGINDNIFFDREDNAGHYSSSYKSGYGFCAGIGIDSVKADWLLLRFSLKFDNYSGELHVSNGGNGGGSTTDAKIEKSIISLGIYPANFCLFHKLHINLGIEASWLISETFSGTNSGWIYGGSTWNYNLKDKFNKLNASKYSSLCGSISYDIRVSSSIMIAPQYTFHYGLTADFEQLSLEARSMRHTACLEVKWKFR